MEPFWCLNFTTLSSGTPVPVCDSFKCLDFFSEKPTLAALLACDMDLADCALDVRKFTFPEGFSGSAAAAAAAADDPF